MPSTAEALMDLLDLEAIDLNLFRGKQPDTGRQRVFGGQVAAQALVAATRTAPPETSVHSLHSYFLRPGDHEMPIVYDVDRLRDGRSFATRRVIARQHGRPIYALTASFQVQEDGFEHQDVSIDVPAPADSVDVVALISGDEARKAEWLREWAALDFRIAERNPPLGGRDDGSPALAAYWVKVAGRLPDDPLIHRATLTYLSDLTLVGVTLLRHGLHPNHPRVQAASLDHTIWFHKPFRADDWLLYRQTSPMATGGRGLALGELFREDGVLVASVAQEGLIRPVPSED
jgi:acyl-CoA thioesterase II